jgi:hypothetical protein
MFLFINRFVLGAPACPPNTKSIYPKDFHLVA